MTRIQQTVGLVAWLLLSFAAAAVGAAASVQAATFYRRLSQPAWAPPASVFGPAWSVLYTLMGIAAWLVWRAGGFGRHGGVLILFVIQLTLDALWSWLFFGWHLGALAFADIVILWLLIAATLIGFWRVRPSAGMLLVPYLGWVGFAAALNYVVWHMNPQILG